MADKNGDATDTHHQTQLTQHKCLGGLILGYINHNLKKAKIIITQTLDLNLTMM